MSAKHTPGPWNTYVNDHRSVVVRKMFDDQTESNEIARCCSGFADARLIAAAPDLLEALKAVVRVADRKTDEFDAARAAIARAEGKV